MTERENHKGRESLPCGCGCGACARAQARLAAQGGVLATLECTQVEPFPFNRRRDEEQRGEHVRFTGGLYFFVEDPTMWGVFKVGAKYELRVAEVRP